MITRCTNPNSPTWRYYGARGITVCERWLKFENFLADMGERPDGLTLDRTDNDGNYWPGNCQWVTHAAQMRNRRLDQGGEKNPNARLNAAKVIEIRTLAATTSQGTLAKRFGVSQAAINNIIHRRSWAHI